MMTKIQNSQNKVKERPQNRHLIPAKKGEVRNPNGRPKGTRNAFAEVFLKSFLEDFNEHGVVAIQNVRITDPSTYLRVAASILPKELNINEGETALERLLEKYSNKELDQLIAGLCALGSSGEGSERAPKERVGGESIIVH